jgi:hypothetical protein
VTNNGLGHSLGDFFINSSGHPDSNRYFYAIAIFSSLRAIFAASRVTRLGGIFAFFMFALGSFFKKNSQSSQFSVYFFPAAEIMQ